MHLSFSGKVFEWRGPAPFYFIAIPEAESEQIHDVAHLVTYGWGVIPASVTIGSTTVTTSLFPKNGGYLVPLKNALRLPENLTVGDNVPVELHISA